MERPEDKFDWWVNPGTIIRSRAFEIAMRSVVLRTSEYALSGKELSPERLREIENNAKMYGMLLIQALSLRQQLLTQMAIEKKLTRHQLPLVQADNQKYCSTLFEKAIAVYLRRNNVAFISDNEGCVGHHEPQRVSKYALVDPSQWRKNASGRLAGPCCLCGQETTARTSTVVEGKLAPRCVVCPRPDFILEDAVNVRINGHFYASIKWIECKNFYGAASVPFMRAKMKRQVQRYSGCYGRGAIVFRRGFCLDLPFPVESVILLDAAPLDLRELTAFESVCDSHNI